MNKHRCTEAVFERGMFSRINCSKPAKHDPDKNGNPTKCGLHCAATKNARIEKQRVKAEAWKKEYDRKNAVARIEAERNTIIRQIAEGHNDPANLCRDYLTRLEAAKGNE